MSRKPQADGRQACLAGVTPEAELAEVHDLFCLLGVGSREDSAADRLRELVSLGVGEAVAGRLNLHIGTALARLWLDRAQDLGHPQDPRVCGCNPCRDARGLNRG